MDLLPTDIEDIVYVIDHVVPAALPRDLEGDPVAGVNWFSMAQSAAGPMFFSALNAQKSDLDPLEGWDGEYCESIHNLLDGGDSISVESNEWKWTDLQVRYARGEFSSSWVAGVCTVLLFASDIMAAEIGPGLRRSMRGVHLAQALAIENRLTAPELATWPVWRLLASLSTQLQDPNRHLSDRRGVVREPPAIEKYLSIIVQARNDDYAGRMLDRFNNFLQTSALQLEKEGVDGDFAEILVIEWNPPSSSSPLAEVIEKFGTKIPIRVITVPKEIHASMPHHKALPLFEHVAENVGFRRAKGRFILKTNIDNIWSPALARFLVKRVLREDSVYRATYLEYNIVEAELNGQPEALLSWLFGEQDLQNQAAEKLETLAAKYPEDSAVCESGDTRQDHPGAKTPWYWSGSGDFVLASRKAIWDVRGYPEISQNYNTDDFIHCRLRASGIKQVLLLPPCATVHQNHRRINRIRANTRWIVTEENFEGLCENPFEPLPTEPTDETAWGFPEKEFIETLV